MMSENERFDNGINGAMKSGRYWGNGTYQFIQSSLRGRHHHHHLSSIHVNYCTTPKEIPLKNI